MYEQEQIHHYLSSSVFLRWLQGRQRDGAFQWKQSIYFESHQRSIKIWERSPHETKTNCYRKESQGRTMRSEWMKLIWIQLGCFIVSKPTIQCTNLLCAKGQWCLDDQFYCRQAPRNHQTSYRYEPRFLQKKLRNEQKTIRKKNIRSAIVED